MTGKVGGNMVADGRLKAVAECVFCRIAAGEIPSDIVYEDADCVAFRDVNKQAPAHVLIVPREHVVNLAVADREHRDLLGHLLLVARKVAEADGVAESGFRVVINSNADAGQSVDHLHVHVLGGRAMRWPPG